MLSKSHRRRPPPQRTSPPPSPPMPSSPPPPPYIPRRTSSPPPPMQPGSSCPDEAKVCSFYSPPHRRRFSPPPSPPIPSSPPPAPSMPRSTSPPPPPMQPGSSCRDEAKLRSFYSPPYRRRFSPPPPPLILMPSKSIHPRPSPPPPPPIPSSPPPMPSMPQHTSPVASSADQSVKWFKFCLPQDGRIISVYEDRDGTLMTNHGGQIRLLTDVFRELDRKAGLLPPQPHASSSTSSRRRRMSKSCAEEDQPAPTHDEYVDDMLNRSFADFKLQISQSHAKEDQPAPQQTVATPPHPGLTREGSVHDTAHKLEMSKWCDVSSLTPTGLLIKYFLRVDQKGLFHIYPDRGGPFPSADEAQEAIDLYHVVERQNLCMHGRSSEEMSVRYALYWHHDGTRKNSAEAFAAMGTYRPVEEVVKALLDKYNEDNSRFGDLAYVIKDIVGYKPCFDGKGCAYRSYSHLNMTMKNKGADSQLFFAEVTCMVDEHEEYVLTSFCAIGPDDNGECHVCGDEVKHPSKAEYKHGRFSPHITCCLGVDADDLYDELITVHDEAWLKEKEASVRRMFKEVGEAIKANSTGVDTRGKSAKYVVPAKRKWAASNAISAARLPSFC